MVSCYFFGMSIDFWPIPEKPLNPGEIVVSMQQFHQIALLGERLTAGEISELAYMELALLICPQLAPGDNKLIVRSANGRTWPWRS